MPLMNCAQKPRRDSPTWGPDLNSAAPAVLIARNRDARQTVDRSFIRSLSLPENGCTLRLHRPGYVFGSLASNLSTLQIEREIANPTVQPAHWAAGSSASTLHSSGSTLFPSAGSIIQRSFCSVIERPILRMEP